MPNQLKLSIKSTLKADWEAKGQSTKERKKKKSSNEQNKKVEEESRLVRGMILYAESIEPIRSMSENVHFLIPRIMF